LMDRIHKSASHYIKKIVPIPAYRHLPSNHLVPFAPLCWILSLNFMRCFNSILLAQKIDLASLEAYF
jgi:hypothetical protein